MTTAKPQRKWSHRPPEGRRKTNPKALWIGLAQPHQWSHRPPAGRRKNNPKASGQRVSAATLVEAVPPSGPHQWAMNRLRSDSLRPASPLLSSPCRAAGSGGRTSRGWAQKRELVRLLEPSACSRSFRSEPALGWRTHRAAPLAAQVANEWGVVGASRCLRLNGHGGLAAEGGNQGAAQRQCSSAGGAT